MRVFCFFLLVLGGCASTARFERDKYSTAYHAGGDRLVVSGIAPTAKHLAGVEDATAKQAAPPIRPEDQAMSSLFLSGLSLAMNSDYYKSPYIKGFAQCHFEHEPDFKVPCGNFGVEFRDHETGERYPVQVEGGEFSFEASDGRSYEIALVGERYRFSRPLAGLVRVGDSIVLHLTRNSPKSE